MTEEELAEIKERAVQLGKLQVGGEDGWSDEGLLDFARGYEDIPKLIAEVERLQGEGEAKLPWQNFRLSQSEWHILRKVVMEWIDEGFSIPPYHADFYDILDKLHIQPKDVHQYDITRPLEGG